MKFTSQMIMIVNILLCDVVISSAGILFPLGSLLQQQVIQLHILTEVDLIRGRQYNCLHTAAQRLSSICTSMGVCVGACVCVCVFVNGI